MSSIEPIRLQVELDDDADLRDVVEYFELFLSAMRGLASTGVAFRVTEISKKSPLKLDVVPFRQKTQRDLKSEVDKLERTIASVRAGRIGDRTSKDAVRRVSVMTRAFVTDRRPAQIMIGEKTYKLDEGMAEAADEILGGFTSSYGAISGRLEAINVHGKRRTFRIYSEIPPYRITCRFSREMMHQIGGAVGEMVEVEGLLRYRKHDAFPFEVRAEAIKVLQPMDSEDWLQLRGSAPMGIGAVEEVRAYRDSWEK